VPSRTSALEYIGHSEPTVDWFKGLSPLGRTPQKGGSSRRPMGLSSKTMPIGTFNIRLTKPKVVKTGDGTDVAARYFVYKLYEATDGQPMQWQILLGMGESAATISRAVERGWVILEDVRGRPLDRKAALTDEGRRLARKGR
jgi:hypothetical protein